MQDSFILGVILAGGGSRRMQGLQATNQNSATADSSVDKSFVTLGGTTLLDHVTARAKPQVDALTISTNSHDERFQTCGFELLKDAEEFRHCGPLAGIHAALHHAKKDKQFAWLATFPVDSPFFPSPLVSELFTLATAHSSTSPSSPIVCASYRDKISPLFSLWSVDLFDDLTLQLRQGLRKVTTFLERHNYATVGFDALDKDPFWNINAPEDLVQAEKLMASL